MLVEVAAVPEGAVVQVQVGRHAADDAAVQIVANPQSHEPLVAGAHWTNRRQVLAVVLLEVGAVPEGDCGVDDVWVAIGPRASFDWKRARWSFRLRPMRIAKSISDGRHNEVSWQLPGTLPDVSAGIGNGVARRAFCCSHALNQAALPPDGHLREASISL